MHYYKPEHFIIQELFDEQIINMYGNKCWSFIDSRLLYSIDQIRNYFNKKITINDWFWGGQFSQRGFRTDAKMNAQAPYSQHVCGRAVDFDVDGLSANDVRLAIITKKNTEQFQYITAMEKDVNWIHIDVRNISNRIFLFGSK
jgi:hypothetical protein